MASDPARSGFGYVNQRAFHIAHLCDFVNIQIAIRENLLLPLLD